MKSDKARKVTSREYIMKLIYQIEMNKEDIENIEERLDIFLNDNLEYIINRYEELRLQYSNNPNVELNNIQLDDAVDKEYMNIICENLKEMHAEIEKKCFYNFTLEEKILLRRFLIQVRDNLNDVYNEVKNKGNIKK